MLVFLNLTLFTRDFIFPWLTWRIGDEFTSSVNYDVGIHPGVEESGVDHDVEDALPEDQQLQNLSKVENIRTQGCPRALVS